VQTKPLSFTTDFPKLTGTGNVWLDQLLDFVAQRELILRTVPVSKAIYLDPLRSRRDWEKYEEDAELVAAFTPLLREQPWMVEVSVPDLFFSNLRKLGEILLDGGQALTARTRYRSFMMGRFPGRYLLFLGQDPCRKPMSSRPCRARYHSIQDCLCAHDKIVAAMPLG
jgi:hypothetical protein